MVIVFTLVYLLAIAIDCFDLTIRDMVILQFVIVCDQIHVVTTVIPNVDQFTWISGGTLLCNFVVIHFVTPLMFRVADVRDRGFPTRATITARITLMPGRANVAYWIAIAVYS